MLVIRLQRTGRVNTPAYRLVLAEKHRAVKGRFLEILGYYLLDREPNVVRFQEDRIFHWLKHGAIPSNTVARLLHRQGMKGLETFIRPYTKRKPKAVPEAGVGGSASVAVESKGDNAAQAG